MKPVVGQTTFGASTSGTTTQLDNNFLLAYNALNDLNTYSNFLTDTGSANSVVVNLGANLTGALTNGLMIQVKIAAANTGATNLNYNSGGNLSVKNIDGTALTANQLPLNGICQFQYRASDTSWLLMTPNVRASGAIGTPQATTSGTAFDFSIPAGTSRISVSLRGVSLSGTDNLLVQLGTGGVPTTSGYISTSGTFDSGTGQGGASSTAGFIVFCASAADINSGIITLILLDASTNAWTSSHSTKRNTTAVAIGGGDVAIAGAVDFLRITRTGTDTFDAGAVNIAYG